MPLAVRTDRMVLALEFFPELGLSPAYEDDVPRSLRESEEVAFSPYPHAPSLADMARLMAQLEIIVRIAGEVADAEYGHYLVSIGTDAKISSRTPAASRIERMRMESPLLMVIALTGAISSIGVGAVALAKLIEHVFNSPVRIAAERERLLTEAAEHRLKRAEVEQRFAELGPPASEREEMFTHRFRLLDAEIRWED